MDIKHPGDLTSDAERLANAEIAVYQYLRGLEQARQRDPGTDARDVLAKAFGWVSWGVWKQSCG